MFFFVPLRFTRSMFKITLGGSLEARRGFMVPFCGFKSHGTFPFSLFDFSSSEVVQAGDGFSVRARSVYLIGSMT